MRYQDFVIRIDACEDACRVQVSSPAGEGQSDFILPFSVDQLGGLLTGMERGVSRREAVLVCDDPPATPSMTPYEFGGRLFVALFSGQVALLFDRSWGQVTEEPGRGLRIRLQFDLTQPNVARLASLPWEYLYREVTGDFLALDRRSPILRYLEVPSELRDYPLPPRLRILVIAASPAGLAPIGMADEISRLEKAWGSEDVEIVFPEHPDLDTMVATLTRQEINIVHFIGHGDFEPESGEGVLFFQNEKGGHQVVNSSTLADLLRGFDSLRLVFLNCCHSARSTGSLVANPFTGVATALVRRGIPAVLGMQFPITDAAAIRFSRVVYQSLAKGDSIDAATTHGRLAIRAGDARSLEWGTPVLFSRVADGRIFDSGGTAGPDDPIFWSWLWSGLGVVTSYLTLLIWASTIKAGEDTGIALPGIVLRADTYSAAVFGIFPLNFLVLAQMRLADKYHQIFKPKAFWNRWPLPFGLSRRRLGRFKNRIQALFLILFVVLPVSGQVHFMNKIFQGTVASRRAEDHFGSASGWEHFIKDVPFSVIFTDDYRFHGVTFFPFWEPWFFLILVSAAVIYFLILMKRLIWHEETTLSWKGRS